MNHISNEVLNKYLENELTETEFIFVENHLKECELCRKELEFNEFLFSRLKENVLITPEHDFSEKVMEEVLKSAKPKLSLKRILNSQNVYILFFISVIGLYCIISMLFNNKETKSDYFTDYFTLHYKKTIDFLYTNFEPLQKYINMIFQKNGFFYFFLGITFIIFFLLFDKYILEKKPKQKSIGTFLI
jgi:hypothetical protein